MELLDCEYHLTPGRGQLKAGSDLWAGPVDLGPAVLHSLQQKEIKPEAYGTFLFDVLFPPGSKLREGYRLLSHAWRKQQGWLSLSRLLSRMNPHGLRFRLHLDEGLAEEAQTIAWELLYDSEQDEALARSSWIAFSRYLSVNGAAAAKVPSLVCPRALIAIADAPDLKKYYRLARLNREGVQRSIKRIFRSLWGRLSRRFLRGHVTLTALQQALQKKSFNILHLVAHGYRPEKSGEGLILQDEDGLVEPVGDEALAEAFLGSRALRLVVFLVCHSGAARRDAPFRGLPWRLLQRGVPAVVAMRREISIPAAELFASTFYPALAKSGEVDVAINTARRQLYLKEKDHWGDPVLFMKEAPWRKSRRPVLAAVVLVLVTVLALGLALPEAPSRKTEQGTGISSEPAPIAQRKDRISERQEETAPPPTPPTLQEIKVSGIAVKDGQELAVYLPYGDIEGKLQGRSETYTIQAVSSDGRSVAEPIITEASPGQRWILPGVPFRTPLNPGETHAQITVQAGSPPAAASKVVQVRAPAPRIRIERICGRPANTFGAGCDPFTLEGEAGNLLEGQEKLWIQVTSRRDGDFWQRCLAADVSSGRWRAEGSLGDRGQGGTYLIRVGLVEVSFEGHVCPNELPPLIERVLP